ncbi:MAG: hypothetical protein JO089_02005, partial [Alphaproteobacteria bacterium]|nr:hypothetical protein [Alphaproteobacteria bacterium]
NNNGIFTANLGANPNSSFYTITLDVTTQNADGTLSSGQVQYQVTNPDPHALNTLYGATAANGSAVLKAPQNTNPLLTASLVDAHGNELPKVNGQYLTNQSGYLKLTAAGNNAIAINSQDSKQLGQPNTVPAQPGTNRNFSYYFELNNFFNDNKPTATGDTVAGSAANLSVQTRLINNPNLISSGQLQQTPPLADGTPVFTYERSAGDNSILQQFAALGNANILFTAAGGLGNVSTSLNGYAGQILSFSASNAATAQSNFSNAKLVANNLNQQITSQSGVNLDQELANTVIYQNAYTASARIVTVTNSLFNTLLQSFQ